MKKIYALILSALVFEAAYADNGYLKYYQNLPVQMPAVTAPVIPVTRTSLSDFGGRGDGITSNTKVFRAAILSLSQRGGGHLEVPDGIYLTGPISMMSNIDLHLEKNAIIVFSPDKKEYQQMDNGVPELRTVPEISGNGLENISITGEGAIDGNGEWWRYAKKGKMSDEEWKQLLEMGGTVSDDGQAWYPFNLKHFDNIASTAKIQEHLRNQLILFKDCRNIMIQGVTVMNSPQFHIVPQSCSNVIIDGVTVRCPWNAQNGDAMDIGNCRNVLIVNNTINAGDDGICMKGGTGAGGAAKGPCENINIQDNVVFHAHGGFVIGSDVSGGMKNIVVRNNRFMGTDTGLRFKSAIGRGGPTRNIFIDHIYMTDIKDQAIVFQCDYEDPHGKSEVNGKKNDYSPDFKDIHISDVVCRGARIGISANGAPGMVHDIDIKNTTIFYTQKSTDINKNCGISLQEVRFFTFSH
ncbi:MAG: glycoside hydrolase family 28 protein [Prevotella sp.]|jgi:polygalacturonase|nr:glycoside hydrolase family 28 protein [Prevotella sp.]MCI1684844.1 glycoside hydrolase family 28 protein [Prevotella sp.]MCI1803397.1 glycoside hydrolase family 28 protein [Prevotella sp.]MCI1848359.1 glycoside hydrolase family 28 protein [Prevotella sp.]MCI2138370.1 glycoside hydrolase family 28 protein [Prevotella sp.]MCI2151290.1 glycoside hydrolase family 28 protein [Prevotella sp.]